MSRALAALCIGVLLAGEGLPVALELLREPPVEMCCGRAGRCCCAGRAPDAEAGSPCLRRACGCGSGQDPALPLLMRAPALLPTAAAAAPFGVLGALGPESMGRPRSLYRAPGVPPPKPLLPA